MLKKLLLSSALIAISASAHAQNFNAMRFVTTCGTVPPPNPLAPNLPYFNIDANGNLCVSGGGGGGGGTVTQGPAGTSAWLVNLSQVGGAAFTLGQKTTTGSLPVVFPSNPDTFFASGTLTAADTGSTTAAGQNGVSVISGTPTAGSTYSQAVNGQSEAVFTITGTFAQTIQFEGSANNGATWTPRTAYVMGTGYTQTQVTAPGVFHVNSAGLTNVRTRAVAFTSGTATVSVDTTASTGSIYVMNPVRLFDPVSGNQAVVKTPAASTTSDAGVVVTDPSVVGAITNTAVATVAAGQVAAQAVPVAPQNGSSFPTAPLSAAPNIRATAQSLGSGTATAIFPTGTLGTTTLNLSGTATETVTVYGSSDDTNYTDQLFFRQMGVNGSLTAPTQSVATTGAAINNNYLIETAGYSSIKVVVPSYTSGALSAFTLQTGNQRLSRVYNSPFDPLSTVGQYVAPQRSSALETCHTFTKPLTTSTLRGLALSGASTSAVWLDILDGTAAPASGASVVGTLLIPPLKIGSDGANVGANLDFSGAPVPSTNGFTACLATNASVTSYSPSSATVYYTGQVQ